MEVDTIELDKIDSTSMEILECKLKASEKEIRDLTRNLQGNRMFRISCKY